MKTTQPWHWTTERILSELYARNAIRAVAGKSSPIAARIIASLEKGL